MQKLTADDPETKSPDLVAENIAKLKELFPELITEGKDGASVNADVLKQLVGDQTVTDAEEKYGLNWHGKRKARHLALTPSVGTLRPCREGSVDWDTTQNLMIEGDNLEVLKLLQKSYAGKVKLIYIDPPYNTGKDFVYPDNFQDNIKNYLELTGQSSEGGRKLSSNTESSGRFHTDWLNMMYPRLKLARNLLLQDGLLFVSIDDHEVANLRIILDEVFGSENFIENYIWESSFRPDNSSKIERENSQHILCYAKSKPNIIQLVGAQKKSEGLPSLTKNSMRPISLRIPKEMIETNLPDGVYPAGVFDSGYKLEKEFSVQNGLPQVDLYLEGRMFWTQRKVDEELHTGTKIVIKTAGFVPYIKKPETGLLAPTSIIPNDDVGDILSSNAEMRALFDDPVFSHPKPISLIKYLIKSVQPSNGDLVLDFFAGSGTTGHAAMEFGLTASNLRFLLIQLPTSLVIETGEKGIELCNSLGVEEKITELTKERLRRAGKKIKEGNPMFSGDTGFRVFKLDSTNIREWQPKREFIGEELEDAIDHLKTKRTEQDILFELLLKLGLDLCVPIEQREIAGKIVHSIGAGTLIVCLAEAVSRKEVEPLALGIVKWHAELSPAGETQCIFLDSAFADDVAKSNLTAILEQHGLKTVRSL